MTEPYVQEPAEEYGEQLHVDNQIEYNFTPLPNAVYAMWSHIGNDALLVYILLVKFADRQTHICWPSIDTMRTLTGFGKNKLTRCIKVLREHNMVATHQLRKGREYGTNRYTLLPEKDWSMVSPKQGHCQGDSVRETPQRIHKQDPVKQERYKQDSEKDTHHTRAKTSRKNADAFSAGFVSFWTAYPRKVGKLAAWKSWKRQRLDSHVSTICDSVADHLDNDEQWKRGYVPHPTTYLNQGRWMDDCAAATNGTVESPLERYARKLEEQAHEPR